MPTTLAKRMSIIPITLPIIAENLLRYTFYLVDMAMLSTLVIGGVRFGDDAVAAVGAMGSFVFFVNIFFNVVNTGSGIVISQYNGAREHGEAARTVVTCLALSAGVGLAMSLGMFFFARPIVALFGLNPVRDAFAGDYLFTLGSLSIAVALNTSFATILRAYGWSREPMIINLLANLINVFGNYVAIYAPFGLPQWGVTGVAASTVLSQGVAAAVMFVLILKKKEIGFALKEFARLKRESFRKILRIGIPTSAENLAYNLAGMVMIGFVAAMDSVLPPGGQVNLPAYNYAFIVSRFIAHYSLSIGQGTQVVTGYLVGGGRKEEAYRKVLKYFYLSFLSVVVLTVTVSLLRFPILSVFPMADNVLAVSGSLLLMCMALETGRIWNLVIISALKGAGDVIFPVVVGLVSMWGIGVGGAFFFGVVLKLGVAGIWLGIALDEWTRGAVMYFRWRSRLWQAKRVIDARPLVEEA